MVIGLFGVAPERVILGKDFQTAKNLPSRGALFAQELSFSAKTSITILRGERVACGLLLLTISLVRF